MSALPVTSPTLARVWEQDRDAEWVATLAAAPAEIKNTVGAIVAAHKADMADDFYAVMLDDPNARRFLDNESVHTRLHASLQRWMDTLFGGSHDQAQVMAALQRQVGEVHARAEIPVQLVSRGMRLIKTRLFDHLVRSSLNRADLVVAVEYISSLMDLAFAEMSSAYVRSHEEGARTDEMFRMITAGQNMALERQRQLAALTDWENTVLRAFVTRPDMLNILPLRTSAFGLWMQHKGPLLFEEAAELASIAQHIERLDGTLLPLVANEQGQSTELGLPAVLRDLISALEESKYLVNALFDRLTDLEAGRDVLTQLYNRRFLQTILRRAMKLAMRHENAYAVLMMDVDHFKRVNDQHGHDIGDRVLQHVAAIMLSHARVSDFFFRYGGEEFLAVLNEVSQEQAMIVAEKIRHRIETADIGLGDGKTLRVSISIGVAVHDGHPDFQQIINRADEALYQAKQTGRNRVVLSQPQALSHAQKAAQPQGR